MPIVKNRLREIIEKRGIKQKWLAEKSGVSEQTISNCQNERFNVTMKVGLMLAKALDMKAEDIFYLVEDGDEC